MPNTTHCDECGGPCAECDCVESPMSPLVLAGHLALCQGQRESVNQMAAAAARKDVQDGSNGSRCGGEISPPQGESMNCQDQRLNRQTGDTAAWKRESGYQGPPAATLLRQSLELIDDVDWGLDFGQRSPQFVMGFVRNAIEQSLSPVQCGEQSGEGHG